MNNTNKPKKYLLTAEVDIEQLIETYIGGDETLREELPPIEELILFECGWLNASGLQVYKVEKIKEQ